MKEKLSFWKDRRVTETMNFLLGSFIYAAAFNLLIIPIGLYNGGFMGISQLLELAMKEVLGIPIPASLNLAGILYFLVNIPLFYIGFRILGGKFTIKTLFTVGIQSIFLVLIPVPATPVVQDYLTGSIIGGIACGVGCGLVLRGRASGGGQDIIGLCCSKKNLDLSVGKIGIAMNILVYGICLWRFDVEIVIYSLIFSTIVSLLEDQVHIQNINTGVMIFTKTPDIAPIIAQQTGRGITRWDGAGVYTNTATEILYTVTSKYEAPQLKALMHRLDPQAFMVFTDGCTVEGNFEKRL